MGEKREDFALDTSIIFPRIKGNGALKRKIDDTAAAGSLILIPPHAYYETMRGLRLVNWMPMEGA
jgi:hypothetical protein